jgi:gamma-glutamyl:cysteine ligase YbdK (ATP-grasp superfamily)
VGIEIEREDFSTQDFDRFAERLRENLEALRAALARPGFGQGAASLGAELEMHLVDRYMQPAAVNEAVLESAADPQLTLELNRYNLEYNARPVMMAGRPFAGMRAEFDRGLSCLRAAAKAHEAEVAMVGILPTVRASHLSLESVTPRKRFFALSDQLRSLRGSAFELRINGEDSLIMRAEDVALEGANTSWQLHLKVDPEDFSAHYNAAQLATPVALAVSGNSPFFCGHRLWEETRVAVFKQSVDPRSDLSADWHRLPRVSLGSGWVRKGALELFEESVALHAPLLPVCSNEAASTGGVPLLEELRLHHGTVWNWNRAVFDPVDGSDAAHLRVEFRALPAGPTLTDMLANSAFILGLTMALAKDAERWMPQMPFEHVRHDFYRSAQHGLEAELLWPTDKAPSPERRKAGELASSLIPMAIEGLVSGGVQREEADELLGIIRARIESGQTGAQWQRRRYAHHCETVEPDKALARMLRDYLDLSAEDRPVHTW